MNDKVELQIAGLVAVLLWAGIEKVFKPLAKEINYDLTANYRAFQPLLLVLSGALTALICKTGLCHLLVANHGQESTLTIVLSGILSWAGAQYAHDVATNMKPTEQ